MTVFHADVGLSRLMGGLGGTQGICDEDDNCFKGSAQQVIENLRGCVCVCVCHLWAECNRPDPALL